MIRASGVCKAFLGPLIERIVMMAPYGTYTIPLYYSETRVNFLSDSIGLN